jgi:flavin reductase (DIM6/NTAB) family NADH-FMN oxidoreductase RutF
MQQFNSEDIKSWERFYRANFISCLSGFKPAQLIGTCDKEKKENLAIFQNMVHLGSDPALIGFINRPIEASSHTIENIRATGQYSINMVNEQLVEKAHQTSAKYAGGESEFIETGIEPMYHNGITAPFVLGSPIQIAMRFVEISRIMYNKTFLVVGAVERVWVDETLLAPDGFLNLEKAGAIATLGLDGYYKPELIGRYSYAKPYAPLKKL